MESSEAGALGKLVNKFQHMGQDTTENSGNPFTVHPVPVLSDDEFERIRALVKLHTGINLNDGKRTLVVSRLTKRLTDLGLSNFSEYIEVLQNSDPAGELMAMINRITTNKTDFFRENHHFQFLTKTLLPSILAKHQESGQRVVRVWSAGCSSGEEPYTLAITLNEFFRHRPNWQWRILATDLDTNILDRAQAGVYDRQRVSPITKKLLTRYFSRERQGDKEVFAVKPELKGNILFRRFNLMAPDFPLKVAVDFVFCRNVLIYFTHDDRVKIATNFHRIIKPGGYLFVGHSESLMLVRDLFKYIANTIYQKI